MFEARNPDPGPTPLTSATVNDWRAALAGMDRAMDDAERVEQVRALEELKAAAAASN
jgi:hypothetical protein